MKETGKKTQLSKLKYPNYYNTGPALPLFMEAPPKQDS